MSPGARRTFDERDLVALRADQRSESAVGISNAVACFRRGLVATDGSLARQVVHHGFERRTRWQCGARVIEMENVGHTGRIRSELLHVERHGHDGLL
jgi:hypothetical protein